MENLSRVFQKQKRKKKHEEIEFDSSKGLGKMPVYRLYTLR